MIVAGHKTDNLYQPVPVLAVGDFLNSHPGWVTELRITRPGETEYYIPEHTEIVNGMLFWLPTDADTAVGGVAHAQVWARDGEGAVGAICDVMDVKIKIGISGVPVEIPEQMRPYLEAVLDKAAVIVRTADDVRADREAADQSASAAQQALKELRKGIAEGDFEGKPGEPAYASVQRVEGGVLIRTSDKSGESEALVKDGAPGPVYDDREIRRELGDVSSEISQLQQEIVGVTDSANALSEVIG